MLFMNKDNFISSFSIRILFVILSYYIFMIGQKWSSAGNLIWLKLYIQTKLCLQMLVSFCNDSPVWEKCTLSLLYVCFCVPEIKLRALYMWGNDWAIVPTLVFLKNGDLEIPLCIVTSLEIAPCVVIIDHHK